MRTVKKHGFTLIELLVVIAIIAVLIAFGVANFLGARQRASDVKKKSDLDQLKNSLRLYYNDYQRYPDAAVGPNDIAGCGIPTNGATYPNQVCSSKAAGCQTSADGSTYGFGVGATCSTVYMKLLPPATDFSWTYKAQANGGSDDYCLYTELDNASDADIAASQARCSTACANITLDSSAYVACAD